MGWNYCSSGCHKHIIVVNKLIYLRLASHVAVTHQYRFFCTRISAQTVAADAPFTFQLINLVS